METRILHVIKSLGRGGAETMLLETIKKHNQTNFKFFIIYFLPWKNALVKELEEHGGIVVNIKAKTNLGILLQFYKILKFIRVNKIQLVHCHLPWAAFCIRLMKKNIQIPVLYTEHNLQERYHAITRFLNKITYNLQSHVIAVSNDVKNSIQKSFNSKVPISVIVNGVDTDKYTFQLKQKSILKQHYGIHNNYIIVGNVCVFRQQKRLFAWVDIMEKIIKKNNQVIGLLIGDGKLFSDLNKYIQQKNLNHHILLLGLKQPVQPYLNLFDIFFSTSEYEGLPVAMLEAMSNECCVVTTNAGGIKELITHNENGLMADVYAFEELTLCLEQAILNTEARKKLATNGRELIISKYSIYNTVNQLESLYTQLIK